MIAPNHNVSISSSDLEAVNPDLAGFRLANGSVPGFLRLRQPHTSDSPSRILLEVCGLKRNVIKLVEPFLRFGRKGIVGGAAGLRLGS
jgi:hypothetical protein